jgi:plastocyanin
MKMLYRSGWHPLAAVIGSLWLLGPIQAKAGDSTAGLPQAVAATSQATGMTAKVEIDNFDFSPMTVTVTPGTTITWTNHDDIPHTVVSADDPSLFKSPPLDTDDAYSMTFVKPGTYKYFCSVHPKMVGMIVVKESRP